MKKSRFTESQIIKALQEQQQGRKVQDIARELSIDTTGQTHTFLSKN